MILVLLLGAGLAGSFGLSRSVGQQVETQRQAQARQAAHQLTATFMLLLDAANGPLRSLATLFNGSGRVSVKEFGETVEFIRQQGSPMPGGLGFLVRSTASSCADPADCWVVAYSTTDEGLLKPGSDVSRFGPTHATIAAVLEQQDTLMIGPAYRQASGEQSSFCAVTIQNTRQFGVLVSRVDYAALIKRLYEQWSIQGMALRLEAAFPDGQAMTEYQFIYGTPDATPETVRSIILPASSAGAQFRLAWDILPEFAGTVAGLLATAVMVGGIIISALVTLLVGLWFSQPALQSD